MSFLKPSKSRLDYHIAWITTLPVGRNAAIALLDEQHEPPSDFVARESHHVIYIWGGMSGHNIVIASPSVPKTHGIINVVLDLVYSCPYLKIGLLVGLGAGVPESGRDIRLGDVAVGRPDDTSGGVIFCKTGKAKNIVWERTDKLTSPPRRIRKALASLRANYEIYIPRIPSILQEVEERMPGYGYPGSQHDRLFGSVHGSNEEQEIDRSIRLDTTPMIHYGYIGSGTTAIKHVAMRQAISTALGANCVCLETEAAGLMNNFPCLMVRGICDYADVHKDDLWQHYASATAAAFAKDFLSFVSIRKINKMRNMTDVLEVDPGVEHLKHDNSLGEQRMRNEKVVKLLRRLYKFPYAEQKDRILERYPGTCEWFTQHRLFTEWLYGKTSNILWVTADPGAGKSVLARYLVDQVLPNESRSICYLFFNQNFRDQSDAAHAGSAILHQILLSHPDALTDSVIKDLEAYDDEANESFPRLWKILTSLDRKIVGEIICVIDAIDECNPGDQREIIRTICDDSMDKIKILFLSRPYIDIGRSFDHLQLRTPILHLSGENEGVSATISRDIDLVSSHKIRTLVERGEVTVEAFDLLQEMLLLMPQRTYLWVSSTLETLEATHRLTKQSVSRVLEDLPASVEEAYERILQRSSDPFKANLVLQFLVIASRPFTVSGMNLLLALDDDKPEYEQIVQRIEPSDRFQRTLRESCGFLVTIGDQKVCLLHHTVRDFLLQKSSFLPSFSNLVISPTSENHSTGWRGSISESGAHYLLVKRCMRALQVHGIAELSTSFNKYCAEYWVWHFQAARIPNTDTINEEALALCDIDSPAFHRWWQLYCNDHDCPDETEMRLSQIILPAALGLECLVQHILLKSSALDRGSLSRALSWSSRGGFTSISRILTEQIELVQLDNIATVSELSSDSSEEVFSKLTKQTHSITTRSQNMRQMDKQDDHRTHGNEVPEPAYTIGPQSILMSRDHVETIAQDMAKKTSRLNRMNLSVEQTNRLCDLLQEFALRFGHDLKVLSGFEKEDKDRGRIMKFVHQEAKNIVAAFGRIIARDPQRGMTVEEKMNVYLPGLADPSETVYDEPFPEPPDYTQYVPDGGVDVEAIDNENTIRQSTNVDFDLVHNSPIFRWLTNSISNEFKLQRNNAASGIRNQILSTKTEAEAISHSRRPRTVSFSITTEWDPRLFVREQIRGLKERVHTHLADETDESIFHGARFISLPEIGQTITITGAPVNAQAVTCEEYLNLVWPETGICVLETLKDVFLGHHKVMDENLPNGTLFLPRVTEPNLTVEIIGEIHAVAETVEILAWLTSALRSSPFDEEGICTVKPKLSIKMSQRHSKDQNNITRHYADLTYELQRIIHTGDRDVSKSGEVPDAFLPKYEQDHKSGDHLRTADYVQSTQGSCWHKMFHNPVLVLDYPIHRRDQHEAGLETSLSVISALLRTRQWIMLNLKLYIKGFAAMIIPTGRAVSSLLWHYIYSKDGQYLDFEQDKVQHQVNIDPYTLGNYRHFVGWSSETKSNAGVSWDSFTYNVQRSGLNPPRAETAVKGFTLSTGWSGSGAAVACTIGHKDAPLRVPFSGLGLIEKLREIQKQTVILWDTSTKRGWLIDGLSALLHLVRATAAERWDDVFKKYFKLRPEQLVEPKSSYPGAAMDFFLEPEYQNLKVELEFSRHDENGKAIFATMQDLTEYFFNVLIVAAEAQSKLRYREGYYSDLHYHKYLDGWDFCSLVQDRQEFVPVSQQLRCRTLPWVDFIRSINTITLFGSGFGEIIEPTSHEHELCADWHKLPSDHDYLAIRHETLNQIVRRSGGNIKALPIELTRELIWVHPSASLIPCVCAGEIGVHRHAVQVVLPKPKMRLWNRQIEYKEVDRPLDGAVVFGRHEKSFFHWFRDNTGGFAEGTPPEGALPEGTSSEEARSESPAAKSRQAHPKHAGFTLSRINSRRRAANQVTYPSSTSATTSVISNNSQSDQYAPPSSRTVDSEDAASSRAESSSQGPVGTTNETPTTTEQAQHHRFKNKFPSATALLQRGRRKDGKG